jgi:hypothetical protein
MLKTLEYQRFFMVAGPGDRLPPSPPLRNQ